MDKSVRLLDVPGIASLVPQLQPQLLHRVVQRHGLEECGALLTLATPDQIAAVLDLDLWRAAQAGTDEQFDAERFGLWLDVLVDAGETAAAATVAAMDAQLVTAGLAQHARVFDLAAAAPVESTDGLPEGEVGGYRIIARRSDSWDAIVALLAALDAGHPAFFHRVMQGCRRLSNTRPEIDGLDDLLTAGDQAMFDLAVGRERRRDEHGFVAPPQARAFLESSRQALHAPAADARRHPVAAAYFRAVDWTPAAEPPVSADAAAAATVIVDLLLDGEEIQPQRPLLHGASGDVREVSRLQALLQAAAERDPAALSARSQELAFLANTLAAGCSVQGRAFTVQEASDAAVATCNLGLEHWPRHRFAADAAGTAVPPDFLVDHDLISVFQVGWAVLHTQVCLRSAEQLIGVLTAFRCDDRDLQASLDRLRRELRKRWQAGTPWHARQALEVLAILDAPAWAGVCGLLDECPVMHAAVAASLGSHTRAVSATAFEFIAGNRQIDAAREFMRRLPAILRG